MLSKELSLNQKNAQIESIDFYLFHSVVLQAGKVTEREENQHFPAYAEWPDRLSHHFMWQQHCLGAVGTSVTLRYMFALKGGGFSQSCNKLFGVLHETKHYRGHCQQEPTDMPTV